MNNKEAMEKKLIKDWNENPRWNGIVRPYSAKEVVGLKGSVNIDYSIAKMGAEKFWNLLQKNEPVCALGALTGNQAIQEVQAGMKAIYCSGWQVAGDNNTAGTMYPDQSLYPVDSVPKLVEKINIEFLKLQFNSQSHVKVNKYVIDLNSREMMINDIKLKLTEKEINTISYLSKSNQPVSIDKLQEKVWRYQSGIETHTVETHIYRLRKKILNTFNDNEFIVSNKNGYQIK